MDSRGNDPQITIAITVGAGLRRHSAFENSHHAWLRTIDNQDEDPPFPAR